MLAVVGQGMVHRVGVSAALFRALADAHVNVRMINQGSSELNIIVGVDTASLDDAVRAIYHAFVDADRVQ
jgi:aspartate kinase